MKALAVVLLIILGYLHYRLWVGEGSLATLTNLQRDIKVQQAENARLKARNRLLAAEVQALQSGDEAIEERARMDLGMIKEGETFFMIVNSGDTTDDK